MQGAYVHQNLLDFMTLDDTPACIINGCSGMFLTLYSIAADHSVFSLPSGRKLPFFPHFLKKGKTASVNNYKSISTLNAFSEIYENYHTSARFAPNLISVSMDSSNLNLPPQILFLQKNPTRCKVYQNFIIPYFK
jgi:hypothetical protein